MNRESINLDDPQMAAYALGELSLTEAAEFEARLQVSPRAQAELASMREIMKLLGEGLRGEWESGLGHPSLKLLEPVTVAKNPVIVSGDFRPVRRNLAAAAAVAAIFLVGGLVITNQTAKEGLSVVEGGSATLGIPVSDMILANTVSSGTMQAEPVHVPQLFLAEEVGDITTLDFADESDNAASRIDASYLDAGQVMPAGFSAGSPANRSVNSDRGPFYDRVDSYLPPLSAQAWGKGITTGMIEKRLSKGALEGSKQGEEKSVFVRGYVTMGGSGHPRGSENRVLAGFRPVSISGNPVVNAESDLQILADLNGLQMDLAEVITEMPEGAPERMHLEGILEKSRQVISQLKNDLSH